MFSYADQISQGALLLETLGTVAFQVALLTLGVWAIRRMTRNDP